MIQKDTKEEKLEVLERTNTKQGGSGVDRGICPDCGKRRVNCKCHENAKKK